MRTMILYPDVHIQTDSKASQHEAYWIPDYMWKEESYSLDSSDLAREDLHILFGVCMCVSGL